MKYCTNCGNQMNDDVYFCGSCGCGPKSTAPVAHLKTNRNAIKTNILTLLTFGLYSIILYSKMSSELNITATKYDGRKTMSYALLFFLVGPLTFGIGTLVWFHKFSKRIGKELKRRNISYSFGAGSFWLWNVLGILVLVGPFIYLHKVTKAINLINKDYNING